MSNEIEQGLPRRAFLGTFSKAGLFGALASSPLAGFAGNPSTLSAYPEKGHVFLCPPYLQAPSGDSMCVRWITNKYCYSWVEYGEDERLGNKAHMCTDGLVDAYNRVNCIPLTDLKPGKKYFYRVFSKEIADFQPYEVTYGETISGDVLHFTTPGADTNDVSWLVLNDIHDRPLSFKDLISLNGNETYDYVFLNGDMFDFQTDEQQIIDHLLSPCTELFAGHTPLLFVRGNHETRGKYARDLKNYFTNLGHGQYFSFQHGPVYTVALDTGEDKPDDHPVYAGIVDFDEYRRQQARWLEKNLQSEAAQRSPFRVVMMHIPPFYSGTWHGTMHLRELFTPIFNKYKVDLVISGHTHTYGIHEPVAGQHNFPIVIGGGPHPGKRTLIRVNANHKKLVVKIFSDDGKEAGSYSLNSAT